MEGVYHALFVLITLLYAFSKILKNNALSESDNEEIIMLMQMYIGGLEKSFTTVMQQGKLTPSSKIAFGRRVWHGMHILACIVPNLQGI